MNWRELWAKQYDLDASSKERVDARKLLDNERGRLAELDKKNGSKLLLAWTKDNCVMPDIDDNVPMPEASGWADYTPPVGETTAPVDFAALPRPAPPSPVAVSRANLEPFGDMPPEAAPVAVEKPKRKPRATKAPATPAKSSQAAVLEAALAFIAPVEDDENMFSEFVNLCGGMAVIYSHQLSAGHPIEEALSVAAHLTKLRAALKRAGKSLALTETESGQLSIKGDKLRAIVPCMNADELGQVQPDPIMLQGEFDILKESFKICGTLANENAGRVIEASLLLEANTCTGTNGHVMLQHWHGIAGLPPAIVLPKLFTQAVAKCAKKIIGIGGYWDGEKIGSFTVWYEDGAWMKTQCYTDRWPDIAHIIDIASAPAPVPPGLFDAVEAVKEFVEGDNKAVYFAPGIVMSHRTLDAGAQYTVEGLNTAKSFNHEYLKKIAPYVETIDFATYTDKAYFFGGMVRGVIMGIGHG